MEVDSSSDTRKRTHTGEQSSAHQPAESNAVSSSSDVAQGTLDSPNTSAVVAETMPMTGTGKEQASGGGSSAGQEQYEIERPLSNFGRKMSTYKKVHKFMTFGLADAIINGAPTVSERWLTSYLAEIPWHMPVLYLNPSEYNLLPIGSHCKAVHIKVTYRGSTIQFQTNQSSTGLATLNQINDIGCAHALNKTGWGSNVSYTAFGNAAQPMIPTGITRPKYGEIAGTYRGMQNDFYGQDNSQINFGSFIPKHQVARQTFLYNYWATNTRSATPGTASAPDLHGGWPCIAEKIQQFDGKTMVNKVVLQSSYTPKMAPLKQPLKTIAHAAPFQSAGTALSVNNMGNLVQPRRANITRAPLVGTTPEQFADGANVVSVAEVNLNLSNNDDQPAPTIPTLTYFTPIEKSQVCRSGYWGEANAHVQPSIHIGVQPVPALTTTALLIGDGAFDAWTDTRAYWEVEAVMEVVEHLPTAFPYGQVANVPLGENVLFLPTADWTPVIANPRNDGATWAGLYANATTNVGPDI